jgi:hypothetical protein
MKGRRMSFGWKFTLGWELINKAKWMCEFHWMLSLLCHRLRLVVKVGDWTRAEVVVAVVHFHLLTFLQIRNMWVTKLKFASNELIYMCVRLIGKRGESKSLRVTWYVLVSDEGASCWMLLCCCCCSLTQFVLFAQHTLASLDEWKRHVWECLPR